MPGNTVKVDRTTKWGNPHPWREYEIRAKDVPWDVDRPAFARQLAVEDFRQDLLAGRLPFTVDDVRRELRGRNLACWCPKTGDCHADLLLNIANT